MPIGTEHLVLGTPPASHNEQQFPGCLTTGLNFFVASLIGNSISMMLHFVMMECVLTNVEHVNFWQVYVRISVFWMDLSRASILFKSVVRVHITSRTTIGSPPLYWLLP
jgi:hypothetical protein